MRTHGWRLLFTPFSWETPGHSGFPYALDNGAWTCFQKGRPFDEAAFSRHVRAFGGAADWTVIPDVVAGGRASLDLSIRWMRTVLDECQRGMLAVQDGLTVDDVRAFVGPRVGIFVGGSTPWKLSTAAEWGRLAREVGAWLHIARVNTAKRIRLCAMAGADSFDGTSPTRFSVTTPMLSHARDQGVLPLC